MGKAEETRKYIIERAAPIFNKHGYAGTSMSQLTRAIKRTKGTIYGNFESKDEIALAAFDYNLNEISNRIGEVIHSKEDACDKLIAFAKFYLDSFAEISRKGGCPVLNAAVDSDDVHEPLKRRVESAIRNWMKIVSRIVVAGVTRDEIKPNVNPEHFASLFVSLIEGGVLLSKTTGDAVHLSRNVDYLIHLVDTELRA
ncbi:MAG TPA: TetR/AcrR family transcriptional regulator [Syntrophales bacterium]|nr:TetR/AcrR family transcriptional regulator [Syntrophales bacterium]